MTHDEIGQIIGMSWFHFADPEYVGRSQTGRRIDQQPISPHVFTGGKERAINSVPPITASEPPLILCIDDADIALRIRKLVLGSKGYNVLTANSGEDGLELFKLNPVDLVVADHFLSDKTGTEIAREMKDLKPEIPILIISAATEKPIGLELADGFLAKGEPTNVLLDTIAHLLAK